MSSVQAGGLDEVGHLQCHAFEAARAKSAAVVLRVRPNSTPRVSAPKCGAAETDKCGDKYDRLLRIGAGSQRFHFRRSWDEFQSVA